MTKITWKGEAEGPPSCTWNSITFPAGVAVEVTDEWMIRKAHGNRFFKVEDAPATQWREPATEADPADQVPGVSFFDDPPEDSGFFEGPPIDPPPDYPPVDNRFPLKRGRPPKVRTDGT